MKYNTDESLHCTDLGPDDRIPNVSLHCTNQGPEDGIPRNDKMKYDTNGTYTVPTRGQKTTSQEMTK
jgi:hypothetical protein